jgi:hypothetical protein
MTLAGNSALNLSSNFFRAPAFEGIDASAGDDCESNRDQEHAGFHLLILESRLLIANYQLALSNGQRRKLE